MRPEQFRPDNPHSAADRPERVITTRHTTRVGDKTYNVYTLIELADELQLPVRQVSLELFRETLEAEDGWKDKREQELGPKNIIDLARKYNMHWNAMMLAMPVWAEHVQQVRDADLQYPILVQRDDTVVDGVHRITKAYLEGRQVIDVRTFPEMPEEAVVTEE